MWSVACIENLLLDSEVIYETLRVLRPEEVLQKVKSPNDIEEILKREATNIISHEVLRRLGELIYFKCDLRELLNRHELSILLSEKLKDIVYEECVKKVLERKIEQCSKVYEAVRREIESNKWRETFCAKELLRRIAGIFGVNYNYFIKVLADKYRQLKGVPSDVMKLMEKLSDT